MTTSAIECSSCGAPLDITGRSDEVVVRCAYCNAPNRVADSQSCDSPVSERDGDAISPDDELAERMTAVLADMRKELSDQPSGARKLKKINKKQYDDFDDEFDALYDALGEVMLIDGNDEDAGSIASSVWMTMTSSIRRKIAARFHYFRKTKGDDYAKYRLETAVQHFQNRLDQSQFTSWQEPEVRNDLLLLKRLKDEPLPNSHQ